MCEASLSGPQYTLMSVLVLCCASGYEIRVMNTSMSIYAPYEVYMVFDEAQDEARVQGMDQPCCYLPHAVNLPEQ